MFLIMGHLSLPQSDLFQFSVCVCVCVCVCVNHTVFHFMVHVLPSLAWGILSVTLVACEISVIVQ